MTDILVTPEWLKARLGDPRVKVVDASWYLPAQNRDAKAEFLAGHIPGAVFFDIDAIADRSTDLPHMLPDETAFAAAAGALGLSNDDTIVVYDGMGFFSAPRVWWTLRVFGASDVRILDGGLPAWDQAGYAKEAGETKPEPAHFVARFSPDKVVDFDGVRAALRRGETVLDARSTPRFRGELPEPRPGLPSGHMPGALNLHYDALSDASGRLLAPEKIRELFEDAKVDLSSPVITTCGSGI
ncbi:MAG TPA: sulfurtransferase, partial [Thermoanaerobaculia bacterium]|nr:sulfurtransferase [Thermoanaerobaculia bacterium]